MKTIQKLLLILIIACFSMNCNLYKKKQKEKSKIEFEKVSKCRENWKYDVFEDTLEIKLIRQERKGRYSLMSWPNFFIGVNNQKDTIGVVEYYAGNTFPKNMTLEFSPDNERHLNPDILDSECDIPVFTVSKNPKENDLYCSIKMIYYGKLVGIQK